MIMHTDISDLQKVRELIVDVKKEWYSLGLALGLKQPTLEEIEQIKGSIEARKRDVDSVVESSGQFKANIPLS